MAPSRDNGSPQKTATAGRDRSSRSTSSRLGWVWLALGVVGFGAMVVLAGSINDGSGTGDASSDPEAIAIGAELYAANCAVCHGQELQGSATGPSFLDSIYAPNHHGDEAFQRAAALGVAPHHWNFGAMPPVAGVDREDVAYIVQFVRSEQGAAGIFADPSH